MSTCPNCGHQMADVCPVEPPVGSWMMDRLGGTTMRQEEGWGQPGMFPFGRWEMMWEARGPYTPCSPWGNSTEDVAERKRRNKNPLGAVR